MTTPRVAAALAELVEALAEAVRLEVGSDPAAPDRLLDVEGAAAALSLGRSLIYGEIQAGRLRSIKVGRRRLIPAAAIAEYIAERAA